MAADELSRPGDDLEKLHKRIATVLGPRRRQLTEAVMAEVEQEAVDRMAATFVDETRLKSMDFRNGASMDVEPAREIVAAWVAAARAMLGDAPNYSETEIDFGLADPPGYEMEVKLAGEVDRYVFRVQRRGKLTPHQARKLAEERAEAAEGKLAGIAALCRDAASSAPRTVVVPVVEAGRVLAIIVSEGEAQPATPEQMLREFYARFGASLPARPTADIPAPLRDLRMELLLSEVGELREAVAADDVEGIADALADIEYVTRGTAATYGIPSDAVFAEVHRSNMTKTGIAGKDWAAGERKLVKGAGYEPPRIAAVLGIGSEGGSGDA